MLGDSDGAKGFVFESFRMPSGKDATRDEQVLEVRTNLDPNNQLRHDEAVVTMFISKEAAAQFAGAERHFPDRPPTARPSGAPPRSAAFPPLRHNREQQSSDHQTGKSPLLMAHLPRRKQGNSCGLGPARKFGNTSLDSSLLREVGATPSTNQAWTEQPKRHSYDDERPIVTQAVRRSRM
mmetsp:Transcript_27258/g.82179  ORF Transcript_27258/g.82179 Transcript_27258/m.82179 type:complete len:180 (-) Transcript_27258:504-1043(-)